MPLRTTWAYLFIILLSFCVLSSNAEEPPQQSTVKFVATKAVVRSSVPAVGERPVTDSQSTVNEQTIVTEAPFDTGPVTGLTLVSEHSAVAQSVVTEQSSVLQIVGQQPIRAAQTHEDQLVLFSTRNCPNQVGRALDLANLPGYLVLPNGTCTNHPINLLDDHHFAETWVFVHGNQIPIEQALKRGARVYRHLRGTCTHQDRPIRFIMYSWPSERQTCRIVDAGLKTRRTNAESFFFGSLLSEICDDQPLNILAYSFGARVASGGLHLLNGGVLEGYYLADRNKPVAPIRTVMFASAVENDGLLPGGRYDHALCSTDKLLLMNNSSDQALRFFWIIAKNRPKALGRTGIRNAPYGCCIRQYDWKSTFGKDHSIWNYFNQPFVIDRVHETFAR